MISSDFLTQAIFVVNYDGNKTYSPISEYPTTFSTGYVTYEHVPKNLIPSYFTTNYSPTVEKEVVASEYPNMQNNVFDVFYTGWNSPNLIAMTGNSRVTGSAIFKVNNAINYMNNTSNIYGEFDCKGIVHPCYIEISVKFTGIANGNFNNAYDSIYLKAFTVDELIALRNGELEITFEHAGQTFSLVDDLSGGVLWRDDENATGFYFLSYDFSGWGRNVYEDGGLGSYSYLLPTIGCVLESLTVTFPETIDKKTDWLLTASYGSFPYGCSRRNNWGTGIRTYSYYYSSSYGIYYEQDGTVVIFNAELINSSYASFYTKGYIGNYSGFNSTIPIVTGANSVISNWTLDYLREYHDKWKENQRNFFIPEGTGNFGTTVPLCTLDDIWYHMCLIPVWSTPTHEYEYAKLNENFWYAEMNGNEYVGNLVRGDDLDIKNKVPEWILDGDSTKNEYNPNSDRPQPEPPPIDPDSEEEVKPPLTEGDTILLQTNRRLTTGNDFVTMYNITAEQLQAFGGVLYKSFAEYEPSHIDPETGSIADNFYVKLSEEVTGTLDISAVVNFIVSVRQYPFSVATLPNTSIAGSNNIYIGSGKVGIPIGSTVRLLTSSISVVDAGICKVVPDTPYNDFRDYYNTTVTCFLPYCGTVELNPIEVMNNTLHCYYAIDFYTGECTAFVTVDNGTHQYLCATKSGIMGVLIPITATNSGQLAARHIADNARDSSLVLSAITSMFNGIGGAYMGNWGAAGGSLTSILDIANQQEIVNADRQGRSAVLAPSLSGGTGGASFMLPDAAYIQIRRGTYARPNNYGSTCAYPSTKSRKLASFSGFTQCQNPNLSGITATETEKTMISNLLQTGVYL